MIDILAKIEPTFTLTIEYNGATVVLYSTTKNRLPCGLIHWEGRIDDEKGTPREGSIVTFSDEPRTLLPLGEFFPALVGGQQVVAASRPIVEILKKGEQAPAVVTGAIPILEKVIDGIRGLEDSPLSGGARFMALVGELAKAGES